MERSPMFHLLFIADSLPRLSGSSLDEGQDIRNLHLPEVAAAPSNFVLDLPRIAECRSPRSETVRLSRGSWLLREKRRKRAERRAAEFKELRENEVNKIFPLVHVKARPHKCAQSKEGNLADRRRSEDNEVADCERNVKIKRRDLQKHPVAPCTKGETRQSGGGAEKAGEKGGGCRGMRPWSRYIRAPVPAYARVFVYLCGTPENSADVRERERERATSPPLPYSTRTAVEDFVPAALFSRGRLLRSPPRRGRDTSEDVNERRSPSCCFSNPFLRLGAPFMGQPPCAYTHMENNRATYTIRMHNTNQLRQDNYGSKRELNAISVYPTTRHASSIADSSDANAIKRLASRYSLAIATE
ncbi:hypothetical protein ALC56_09076 [Trachymyrmex septentrionalis]|uniref:Uncharacterized protein n=1 Tax=Trachymyrmex septentrionalis TaxID=34720 RepID=A0A151JUQ1_9HYME|nr:hypothetical protein ALC56_09076 [Trachymyrmex septentrionalis]